MLQVIASLLRRRSCWHFVLLAVAGTCLNLSLTNRATAQIIPDETLGTESSQVTIDGTTVNGLPATLIQSGALRGENVFHSFEQFNVGEGQRVYFENPTDIARVISRVTGDLPSNILGTLGSLGDADIFLLNPNGVVFGPNAALDVSGSFVASTAESVRFADGLLFGSGPSGAAEPSSALLAISTPIGLQYGRNPGDIETQSAALQVDGGHSFMLLGGNVTLNGGQLAAPGGQIEIGGLTATGALDFSTSAQGNLSVASFPNDVPRGDVVLNESAQVTTTSANGGNISVSAGSLTLADRSALTAGLSQEATARDAVAGNISVNTTEAVTLTGSSLIQNIVNTGAVGNAGRVDLSVNSLSLLIGSQLFTSTFGQGNAGRVTVDARETILIDSVGDNASTSGIISSVAEGATGNGGDVSLMARSLSVVNGAQLNAITFGQGDAGNLVIAVRDTARFDGANVGASGILNAVAPSGRGDGGDIEIAAETLLVTNGAQLNTITRGRGDAGNVTANVRETLSIDGENPNSVANPFSGVSAIFTSVGVDDLGNQAVGEGGDISIQTGELLITNGAELNAITRGEGSAGSVSVNARGRVLLDGERQLSTTRAASAIFTSVDNNAYSGFESLMPARGRGGDVDITAESLTITNGALISGLTGGTGDAGDVRINARSQVLIEGENSNGGASGVFSSVADNLYTGQPPAQGEGGDVEITTGSLLITKGAGVFANTRGLGNAGNVRVAARDRVIIDGENSNEGSSGIFSSVGDEIDFPPAVGDGSNIDVFTDLLSITNGGGIFTNTTAQGSAGDITLNAREILLRGEKLNGSPSGLYASVSPGGVGEGGNITIESELLTAAAGAGIFANTTGQGNAGSVTINNRDRISLANSLIRTTSDSGGGGGDIDIAARTLSLTDQSEILTRTRATDGGNITVNLEDVLVLSRNSTISTEAGTDQAGGNGGDVVVNARFVVATPTENNDIVADAFDGNGGNVDVAAADGLFGITARDARTDQSDITASSQNGVSGDINIQTPEVDPSEGTAELPTALVGPDVVRSCRETFVQSGSEFIVSGRGGLSQGPLDSTPLALWEDTLPVEGLVENRRTEGFSEEQITEEQTAEEQNIAASRENSSLQANNTTPIEAQGFLEDEHGKTVLTAMAPQSIAATHLVACTR